MAEGDKPRVALDQIGDKEVSTVFIGLGNAMFETMIFDAEGPTGYQRALASTEEELESASIEKCVIDRRRW